MRRVRVDAPGIRAAGQQQRDQAGAVCIDGGQQRRAALGIASIGERGIGVEQASDGGPLTALDRLEQLGEAFGRDGRPRLREPGV